jgi:MerR family transcriptional regulator, light-induced transcriptional regulator
VVAEPEEMTLQEAAEHLGVHYMTVYRYVRLGRLPATRHGSEWRVRQGDVEKLRLSPRRSRRGPHRGDADRNGLELRMVAGDAPGAWRLIEGRLSGGSDPPGVLTELLVPVLRSIGDRWAAGELSVGDEHRATAVAYRLIGRLGLQFGRRGRTRGTVVLAAPSGDLHALPVIIVADLLRWRSFDVVDLGANTPAEAIGEAAGRADRLIAVGIVSTTSGLDAKVAAAVAAVRAVVPNTAILLGGAAIRSQAHAHKLGGDIWSNGDANAAVDAIDELATTRRARPHHHI